MGLTQPNPSPSPQGSYIQPSKPILLCPRWRCGHTLSALVP